MVDLFVSHIRPILDYCSPVWNVGYLGDMRLLESVQRRWTKEVENFHDLEYRERLNRLGLLSIRGRLLRSDLIKYWKILHLKLDAGLMNLFILAPQRGTRGHSFKLEIPRCHTDLKQRFFSVRNVGLWNSLPANVVECQTLSAFKQKLTLHLGIRLFEIP